MNVFSGIDNDQWNAIYNCIRSWRYCKSQLQIEFYIVLFYLAIERAISLARQADIIAALSTDALRGTVRHLHPSKGYFEQKKN